MTYRPKPQVVYDDRIYSCRRYDADIPDLAAMPRLDALVWLNQNTTKRGHSNKPAAPNLAGLTLVVR
jgi:hypothetical protein